jgi:photosystem II stability/assembly factor-like uncharacterized protein
MKKITFFYITVILLFSATSIIAQSWEKIGWDGGGTDPVIKSGTSLFAATYYDGIYRSDDDGKTWAAFNTGFPMTYTSHSPLIFVSSAHYLIYLCRDSNYDRHIYRTSPASADWKQISFPGSKTSFLDQLASLGGDTLIASVDDRFASDPSPTGVYISPDGGNSWQRSSSGLPQFPVNIKFAPTTGSVCLYAYTFDTSSFASAFAGTYFSTNGGTSWVRSVSGMPDSFSIDVFGSSSNVVAAEVYDKSTSTSNFAGIFCSSNGGQSWYKAMDGIDVSNGYVFRFYSLDSVLLTCMQYNSYKTSDKGANWDQVLSNYDYIVFNSAVNTERGIVLGSDYSNLLADDDITFTTSLTDSYQGMSSGLNAINYIDGSTVFGCSAQTDFGDLLSRSTDNGSTWQYKSFINSFSLSKASWINAGGIYYAGGVYWGGSGFEPSIFTTTDLNGTWDPLATIAIDGYVNSLDAAGDTILIGTTAVDGTQGSVYFSIDAGLSWKKITPTALSGESSLEHAAISHGKFYIATSAGTLYASSNAGKTWYSSFTGLDANLSVVAITKHKDLLYLAGNISSGLGASTPVCYYTTDAGLSWQQTGTGYDPMMYLSDLKSDGKSLFLTSDPSYSLDDHPDHSSVFISQDDGNTWQQVGNDLIDGRNIFIGDQYIFASGFGGGYRFPKPSFAVGDEGPGTMQSTSIFSVYPNPAKDEANIVYSIPKRGPIQLAAYDLLGRAVDVITQTEEQPGTYQLRWDTHLLASGTYLIILSTSDGKATQTISIVK